MKYIVCNDRKKSFRKKIPSRKKNAGKKVRGKKVPAQVGFAELKKTADNRANIGGSIIGAPIVGQ